MRTSLFDYSLNPSQIAQKPVRPRDSSRLMILDKQTGAISHHSFREIVNFLEKGDLLVLNDTKVFNARLFSDHGIEIFLLHPLTKGQWLALGRPGKKIRPDTKLFFGKNLSGQVVKKNPDGTMILNFGLAPKQVIKVCAQIGQVPLPPYIKNKASPTKYQTVYGSKVGSVAAPTAGFHFTKPLLTKIHKKGIKIKFVTLHVGLGTFRPIKTERIEDHQIHQEWASLPVATRNAIEKTKKLHGRVIAVGTTTMRTVEALNLTPKSRGWINLYIKPGYKFKTVDGLITNFHLPRSSLLVLVSAFAGRDKILKAYRSAIRKGYRFFSFGDAMLIR